jgi:hypothetical protein
MKGASDEPNADAISTFLFAVSDAMVTRSLSGHLLSVVVFFLHPKRIRVIKLFHHLGTAGAGQEQPEQVDAVLRGKPAGRLKKNNPLSGYHSAEQHAVIPGYCICNNDFMYGTLFPESLPYQKTG